MKIKLLISILSFMVIFSACSSSDDEAGKQDKKELAQEKKTVKIKNNTLKALGLSLISSLKADSFEEIKNFLPSREDIEDIVMVYDGTAAERKKILAGSKENSKKIKENTRKAFDKIFKKGEDVGINWQSVKFDTIKYDIKPQNNIEYASLTIIFKYKVLAYQLTIAECIKTKRGWLIFDKPKWKG